MNKEFIPYEQALALKELGFDEPCWAWWHIEDCDTRFCYSDQRSPIINSRETEVVGLPTYSQAFRWFREKYLTYGIIMLTNVSKIQGVDCILEIHLPPDKNGIVYILEDGKLYTSYEEAEQACLEKLIEIIKKDAHI